MEQLQVGQKLEHLQRALDAKLSQMARVQAGDGQMANLRAHYDRVLKDLQCERDELQKDRLNLLLVCLGLQTNPLGGSCSSKSSEKVGRSLNRNLCVIACRRQPCK